MIYIPLLYAGRKADITWDEVTGATRYLLKRRFDADFSDPDIMTWDIFDDMYRSKTWDTFNQDWQGKVWDDFDVQRPDHIIYIGSNTYTTDYMSEVSSFATYELWYSLGDEVFVKAWESGRREIIPNRPPVISGQDTSLGTKYRGFEVLFTITDPDPEDIGTFSVFLDDEIRWRVEEYQQGVPYKFDVLDSWVFPMPDGSGHVIKIIATDARGLTSTRTYTFTAVKDLITTSVSYLLKKDKSGRFKPIAKMMEDIYLDYMSAGSSTYKVRAIDMYDNFSDSNEVNITTEIEYGQLALAENPSDMFALKLRRGEPPSLDKETEYAFVVGVRDGFEKRIHKFTGNILSDYSLAFTHTKLADAERLEELLALGEVMIYRDIYKHRVFCHIPSYSPSYIGRRSSPQKDATINYTLPLSETDYSEWVEYD